MTQVTSKYRKDSQVEVFLENLNKTLIPLEKKYISTLPKVDLPVIFILGAPRSGTTLLSQLLAASEQFAYISNFVARFWLAPYVGMYLEKILNIKNSIDVKTPAFSSDLGRTSGLSEPHEFSYFWKYWLKPSGTNDIIHQDSISRIDMAGLRSEVNALLSFSKKPIFFKNKLLFVNPFVLNEIFPNSIFLVIKRDTLSNAVSILRARLKYYGNKNMWFSTKPSRYEEIKNLPVEKQILEQIHNIYTDIEDQIKGFLEKVITISYENLCSEPRAILKRICFKIGLNISEQSLPKTIPARLEKRIVSPEVSEAKRFIPYMETENES